MKNFSQWEGFKGNRWKEKIDVRNFISMNYNMTEMPPSWKNQQKQQTNCGENFRNCRKKNVPKAEFWIWKQRLLHL